MFHSYKGDLKQEQIPEMVMIEREEWLSYVEAERWSMWLLGWEGCEVVAVDELAELV